jgi:signal transduction histidine kinase/CheY-like chemotaxis protein
MLTDSSEQPQNNAPRYRWLSTLQGRLLLALLIMTAAYAGGLWSIRSWQNRQVDSTLQKEVAERHEFFDKLIELRGRSLYMYSYDYTIWDEMVEFASEPDSTWGKENIVESLSTYGANAAWVFDSSFQQVCFANTMDDDSLNDLPFLHDTYQSLFADSPFAHFFLPTNCGLLEIRGATIHPTADDERVTEPKGYFYVAVLWDEKYLDELGHLTKGAVIVRPATAADSNEDGTYDNTGHITWHHALPAWNGQPVVALHVDIQSKEIEDQLLATNKVQALAALLALVLIGFVAWIIAHWVAFPLRRISTCLAREDAAPIKKLLTNGTELGHIARLIRQFFQQKDELVREIEERKRAEHEREKLENQLRRVQRLETIGTLAGGVAHDFNNILTPIIGYSDMAMTQLDKSHPVRSDIEQVIKAAFRARDLVKQILMFSRQGELERKPAQLHLVFKEALKLMRASLPSTIEIHENLNSNCGSVLCDPSQMHQVMMNLCTNAFHAMRENGGILEVMLDSVDVDKEFTCLHVSLNEGRYVRLTVSDTGCGMDRATLERIFEPFFTTKKVGEGTGLGLSVIHGIVLAHGGAITSYSEPGVGSTFRVYLPALVSETTTEKSSDTALRNGRERILFVDDEAAIVEMGTSMLERLGYHVTATTRSEEALRIFKDDPDAFDLLISDQTMPHLTGDRLAGRMLALRPDLPVILISGFSERVTALNYKQIGVREFVMKPLVLRDLSQAIERALAPQDLN